MFSLIPITTSLIIVDKSRYQDLESLMVATMEADPKYRYSVARADSLNQKGRGVLTCGDHARLEQLSPSQQSNPLHYDPKALASAPPFLPSGLLNNLTVRAFNESCHSMTPKHREGKLHVIAPFFHPLDGVQDWSRIYGPAGFLVYQFAVPNKAAFLVPRTPETARQVGAPSFLAALKRFGPSSPGPLSPTIPVWIFASDMPAAVPRLLEMLDHLDEEVAAAEDDLSLAKDSRQSRSTFKMSILNISIHAKCIALIHRANDIESKLFRRFYL